jgi:hypothetical protein
MQLHPIPGLKRLDPGHQYWLHDRPFAYSVTGVLGAQKSDYAMARIKSTEHIWAPRGNSVHSALELFLSDRFDLPSGSDAPGRSVAKAELRQLLSGDYREWIEPMLSHPIWDHAQVIASERLTCCIRRGVAGTYDLAYDGPQGRVLADLKSLGPNGSTYCTRAQLGGYMALEATHNNYYDYGQTIWARPGRTALSTLYSRSECISHWAGAWARWCAAQPV